MSLSRLITLFIVFLGLNIKLYSQKQLNDAEVKAGLIFNICNEVIWEQHASPDTFLIGVYGNDNTIINEIKKLENKSIKNNPIKVKKFNQLEQIENTDILFLSYSSRSETDHVYWLIKNTNTLFVTDRNTYKRFLMINFIHDDNNTISLEINSSNIEEEQLKIKPLLLFLAGEETDVSRLYLETEKELKQEQERSIQIKKELELKEEELAKINKTLANLQEEISQKNITIEKLAQEIQQSEYLIEDHKQLIEKQNKFISNQKDRILNTKELYNQLQADLTILKQGHAFHEALNDKKEKEIKELDSLIIKNNEVILLQIEQLSSQNNIIDAQKRFLFLLILFGFLLLIIIILFIRAYKQKKNINKILEIEVTKRTKELQSANTNLLSEIQTRKLFEAQLVKTERNYREIFNSSTDAIFLQDNKGKIVDVNESMLKMYGYQKEELSDLTVEDLSSVEDGYNANRISAILNETHVLGRKSFDWLAKKKDGTCFWAEVVLKQTTIGGKDRFLAVIRDINEKKLAQIELDKYRLKLEKMVDERTTELKEMNKELELTNDKLLTTNKKLFNQREALSKALNELEEAQTLLIESEKLATIGTIAAGVAHEINNPLNFIRGGIVAIHEYFKNELSERLPEVQELINAVETGVLRAAKIVKSLNIFSYRSESYEEICSIYDIIDNCLVVLKNNLKDKITVHKIYESKLDTVKGNSGKLHQVFINILTNSEHAIEKDGIINISTKTVSDMLEIKISDNGKGIEKKLLNKVMEPFFTTKKAGVGTGLGLTIINKIIKEHDGTLKLESKVNKGTTMNILLPLIQK